MLLSVPGIEKLSIMAYDEVRGKHPAGPGPSCTSVMGAMHRQGVVGSGHNSERRGPRVGRRALRGAHHGDRPCRYRPCCSRLWS